MAIPALADRVSRIDHPEPDDPGVFTYSTNDGFATDFVVHVTAHPAGRIHVTHIRAIDRRDPATSAIKHYSTADGRPGSEFQMAFRDRGGALRFSTTTRIARLMPADEPPIFFSPIQIGALPISGVPYSVSALGARNVGAPFDSRSEQQCSYFTEVVNNMVRHRHAPKPTCSSAPMNGH